VFILAHKQDGTDNLFDMATRFHEHCPPRLDGALTSPACEIADASRRARSEAIGSGP
jgi:hypothetical protein